MDMIYRRTVVRDTSVTDEVRAVRRARMAAMGAAMRANTEALREEMRQRDLAHAESMAAINAERQAASDTPSASDYPSP